MQPQARNSIRNENPGRQRIDQYLEWAADGLLIGLILIAPLFMGGRHPLGVQVDLFLIGALTLVCCVRRVLRPINRSLNSFDCLLLGAVALLTLQITSLPQIIVHYVSPSLAGHLPLWSDGDGNLELGRWSTISLAPWETQKSLTLMIAYAMLFFSCTIHIVDWDGVRRIILRIGIACFLIAGFGIVQFFFGNGKFLWFYAPPYRHAAQAAQGPFVNPNHFAHLIALGIGPLVWAILFGTKNKNTRRRRFRQQSHWSRLSRINPAFVGSLGTVLAAGLLSFSRGGILVHTLAFIVAIAVALMIGKHVRYAVWGLTLSVAIAVCLVWAHGSENLTGDLHAITTSSPETIGQATGREIPWNAALNTFPDYWLAGTGAGTFRDVYKLHAHQFSHHEFTHAESGYLQIAVETGAIGIAILTAGFVILVLWFKRASFGQRSDLLVAIIPGILISAVHSLVDFVWYVPACAVPTIILIACLYRLVQCNAVEQNSANQTPRFTTNTVGRASFAGVFMLALFVGFAIVQPGVRESSGNSYWERYLKSNDLNQSLGQRFAASPSDQPQLESLLQTIEKLEQCLAKNPNHARAHLRLAESLLHQFELEQSREGNGIGIDSFADVIKQTGFESNADVKNWLTDVTGDRQKLLYKAFRHACVGLSQSPMSGDGYLYLAQLSFLYPSADISVAELVDQALRVRPHDGEILFASAVISRSDSEAVVTLDLLRRALKQDPRFRSIIVQQVGPDLTGEQFLTHLDPDRKTIRLAIGRYKQSGQMQDVSVCADKYYELVDAEIDELSGQQRALVCKDAASLSMHLGNMEQSIDFERQAVKADPSDFTMRLRFARTLAAHGDHEEAAKQYRWCLARQPTASLKQEFRDVSVRR